MRIARFNNDIDVVAAGGFQTILNNGYLGIAESLSGIENGRDKLQQSIAAFKEQAAREKEQADDANFGIEQLEYVAAKFLTK